MYVGLHHLVLYCILFRRFLISKINIALQLTKLLLKKVTTTTTYYFRSVVLYTDMVEGNLRLRAPLFILTAAYARCLSGRSGVLYCVLYS